MPAVQPPAWKKAGNTDRWTEILFRAMANRVAKRWRFVSFRGAAGGEWRGIVDVLATRKDTSRSDHAVLKSGDLFELVIIQMKGGGAREPNASDLRRLRTVARRYRAKHIVLFSWQRGAKRACRFSVLDRSVWREVRPEEVFG